ncbi:hypothetical protein NW757_006929 [Fusarium falciforme]|nr:hypothetical protein NW757_006929 [Fusarium falciforme]
MTSTHDVPNDSQPHHNHDRLLAESIVAATRGIHAKLNKLIIARLPLALPPRAQDPALYISGLLHITPIYMTFEALWRDILDSPVNDVDKKETNPHDPDTGLPEATSPASDVHRLSGCNRVQSLLQHVFLPGLMRSDRLKADIAHITGWSDSLVEDQLRFVEQSGRLGDFIQHIKRSVQHRPHVLLAYSYILFMALFAGGRFIRATLESAGDDFWNHLPSPIKPTSLPCQKSTRPTKRASGLSDEQLPDHDHYCHATHTMPLRFFHFQTPEDGEDLKREFKQRLLDAEKMLTTREKQDIVQESVCIFENMTLLIHQLDSVCGDPERKDSSSTTSSLFELVDQFHPFRSRIRDSVSITKERSARTSTLSSDGVRQVWKSWVNTSASSPPQGEFVAPTGHPDVSRADSGAASCPASKSMRFEKALPKPTRTPSDLAKTKHGLQECFKLASQRLQSMHVINWLMLAAFCALTYGALFSARRGEDMALDA